MPKCNGDPCGAIAVLREAATRIEADSIDPTTWSIDQRQALEMALALKDLADDLADGRHVVIIAGAAR